MRSVGILFALLALGCNSSPTGPSSTVNGGDTTIIVQFGHSTQINTDLRVAFDQIVEDSRCPASVVCVWQGNGAIRLNITSGRGEQAVTLNTAGRANFPREALVAGYMFALEELLPQRQTSDPIPEQQYRARIRVTLVQ